MALMAAVSSQLRELASRLTDTASTETIHNVKLKMLSLADDLDEHHVALSLSQNIDDILDEIDEKENENKDNILNETEYDTLIDGIDGTLFYCHCHPLFGGGELDINAWIYLFHKPKNKLSKKYDVPVPFGAECQDIPQQQLLKIWHAIPKEIKDHTEKGWIIKIEKFKEFAKWIIKYKTDPNNKNKKIYDKVYQAIIRHAYWMNFKDLMGSISDVVEFYDKYRKYIDLNRRSIADGETLLHVCVEKFGSKKGEHTVKWLLSQKGIDANIKNYKGETPMDYAKKDGHWLLVNLLLFASMGNKMRQKSNEQIVKLNRNTGIVKQWFRFYKIDDINCDEYKSMMKMVQSLKILIKKRLPISDDMLLLCFNFEMKQNNDNNPLQCSLWQCLYDTLNENLRLPLNRRNWLWFKQYIFNSSLWYQKVPVQDEEKKEEKRDETEDKLLYHLLIEMVSKQLKAQKDYLRPYIDKLENKTDDNDNSWSDIKNYKELIVTDNPDGLRQDECIESGTNKELLPYPIRPIFNNDQLIKLNVKVKEFDCHNHFDIHGYLSKLILTAHSLNQVFHEAMRSIFNIDDETSDNTKDGVIYHQGPVKRIMRSQAKAETDYSHCSWPTTAKIVDFIRCCLVYKNPKDLLHGIDKFVKAVDTENKNDKMVPFCIYNSCGKLMETLLVSDVYGKEEKCPKCKNIMNKYQSIYHCKQHKYKPSLCIKCGEQQYLKQHCLKRILRLKNMFLENKKENNGEWDLYKYADIKMGVLMEYDGQSMIVEVQFLLHFMLKAKSLGHGLYEIERNKDFILSVNKIMNISNTDDNIDNRLRKAVIKGDENELATLILNEAPINLMNIDDRKNSLIHYAAQKKIMKFMLDTIQSDGTNEEFGEFINMKGEYGYSAIHLCQTKKRPEILKLLLSYQQIDVNVKEDDDEETVLMLSIGDSWNNNKNKQIFNMLINDERIDWKSTNKHKETIFEMACGRWKDIEFIKKLWSTGYYEINHVIDGTKKTALIKACNTGIVEIVEFLLSIPNIDINLADNDGYTAIDRAIYSGHIQIVKMLYNRKTGTVNKFNVACHGCGGVEMIKLILELWPDVDVNASDSSSSAGRGAIYSVCKKRKQIDILKFVLNVAGIEVDIVDAKGYSPWLFMMECGSRYMEQIKLLFNRKDIDFNRKVNGKNALDIAIKDIDTELIEWLKSNGFTATNK